MGIYTTAEIRYGIILPEDYAFDHYDPDGANLESDSEWQEYEFADEALETDFERRCEGTNLMPVHLGGYDDEESPWMLAVKTPLIDASSSIGYAREFNPRDLTHTLPELHTAYIEVAKSLGLDWAEAKWYLTWGRG